MENSTAGDRLLKIGLAILITALLEIIGLGWIGAIYLLYVLWQWALHTSVHQDDYEYEVVRKSRRRRR